MGIMAVTEGGRLVKARDLVKVDHLLKLKATQPFWNVVEEVVKMWMNKSPKEWKSYIIHLDMVKADQKRTSIAGKRWRGVSRHDGIERSLLIDFPLWIHLCLKKLYPEENQYLNSKEFFRKMADKFPIFRIREKE